MLNIPKITNGLLTAALTCLVVLGSPSGLANVPPSNPSSNNLALATLNSIGAKQSGGLTTVDAMAMGVSTIPLNPEVDSKRYKMVDTGDGTACAIRTKDSGIECFGFNAFGQTNPPKGKFKSISMGGNHGCALDRKNKLVCWGHSNSLPAKDQIKGKYIRVSAGTDHTCAIGRKGKLSCWGNNTFGEIEVPPGQYVDVSAHGDHTCALTKAGQIACWGDRAFNAYGPFQGTYKNISTGLQHLCAIRANDNQLVCWGNNAYGQATPVLGEFKDIRSGVSHSCGQRVDGTVACWGKNNYGQAQPDGRRYRQLAAGGNQTCFLSHPDSRLSCIGSFKFNDSLFVENGSGGPGAALMQQYGMVTPQNSMGSFIGDGISWFGSSLADGLETFYSTELSNAVKFAKYGNIAFGLASFLVGNLLKEEDPNEARYEEIKRQLEDIKLQLSEISKSLSLLVAESKSTNYIVAAQWCENSVDALSALNQKMPESGISFPGPVDSWRKILDKYNAYLTKAGNNVKKDPMVAAEAARELAIVYSDMDKFMSQYFNPIQTNDNLEKLGKDLYLSLTDQVIAKASPLDVCKTKSHAAWKNAPYLYPFDDRPIWSESYKILIKSMMLQDQIADILTQTAMLDLTRVLRGEWSENGQSIPPYDWDPKAGEQGICERAKAAWQGTVVDANPRLGPV